MPPEAPDSWVELVQLEDLSRSTLRDPARARRFGPSRSRRIAVRLQGAPADAVVTGAAWHPLGRQPDRTLSFVAAPGSGFISRETVPSGRWTIRLEVTAGGHRWRAEQPIA